MNYMWEALLEGIELGYEKEEIRFTPARMANPYREVFFKDFNRHRVSDEPVEVNAYYRYAAVFDSLLGNAVDDYDDLRLALFNILAHFLTALDLREGMCRAEYYAKFLREDIERGLFGSKNAQALAFFSKSQKRYVLAGLLRLYRIGTSMKLFAQLLRELYPESIIYLDAYKGRELLIYIGKKKTAELSAQVDLLCDLFVPADYLVRLFWDKHFGLIGVDETMMVGNIMMY